jgi:hypothetical protein
MPLPVNPSLKLLQLNAICPDPGVAVTVPFVGAVASRPIVAEYGLAANVAFPQASLNHAYTFFVPLPDASVHVFVPAKAVHVVQLVVLLMHIWIG